MNPPGQRDPASYSAQELADPSIDSATLRQIAAVRTDLWPQIQNHSNCDQELAGYIRQNSWPAAPQPPTSTGAQPPFGAQTGGQRPPGDPGPPQGGQPYPQPQAGQPQPGQSHTGSQASQGAQQLASGAKQLAGGAKEYFANTVAPAAVNAAQNVSQRSGQALGGPVHWTIWFRFALPVAALLAIIALFMPIASVSYMGRSMSINYFSEEAPSGEGAIMLVLFLAVIGFAVVSLVTGRKWAIITAGVLGVLAGLIGMINGFGSASAISGQQYGSAGAGAILLGVMGIGMLATAIITFLPQNRLTPPPPTPAPPYPPQQQYPYQPPQPPQGQNPQGGQGHPPYPPQQGRPPQQF